VVASFEATRQLDDRTLRSLLATGESVDRVWAAWALALRIGSAMPDIVAHVVGEPNPGVRRALLAVLAGHGEVDILVALARRDPDADVRGHAMQFVTRLASGGAIPTSVVTDAYTEAPPAIRRDILVSISDGAPPGLRQLIDDALATGEPGGFEAAISSADRQLRVRALAWLSTAPTASADDAWLYLRAFPPPDLVELAAALDREMRERVLRRITERVRRHLR
jgi:hypothetical protein